MFTIIGVNILLIPLFRYYWHYQCGSVWSFISKLFWRDRNLFSDKRNLISKVHIDLLQKPYRFHSRDFKCKFQLMYFGSWAVRTLPRSSLKIQQLFSWFLAPNPTVPAVLLQGQIFHHLPNVFVPIIVAFNLRTKIRIWTNLIIYFSVIRRWN
jgi:hypothetical protein